MEDGDDDDDDDDDDDGEGGVDHEDSEVEYDDGRQALPVHSIARCNLFLGTEYSQKKTGESIVVAKNENLNGGDH